MNNNLKPIDQLLDNWKANLMEQVPAPLQAVQGRA